MSTKEYLRNLDIDQLRVARDLAEDMIKSIEDLDKVALFVVSSTGTNRACYSDDEFDKAKEKVCELIMLPEFQSSSIRIDHPMIDRRTVYESEVARWMELNI